MYLWNRAKQNSGVPTSNMIIWGDHGRKDLGTLALSKQASSLLVQCFQHFSPTRFKYNLIWGLETLDTLAVQHYLQQWFPNYFVCDPQNNHIWSGDPTIFFDSIPQINIVKIADLKTHIASRREAMWAFRSAIFTTFASLLFNMW